MTIYILLGVVITLQLVQLQAWNKVKTYFVKPPQAADITPLAQAFAAVGLNSDQFHPDYDLASTGKMGDVIHLASKSLGKPIRTVDDVQKLLTR